MTTETNRTPRTNTPLRCPPAPTLLTRDPDDRHRRRQCRPPIAKSARLEGHFFVTDGYAKLWTIDAGDLWLCARGHRHRLCRDGYFRRPRLPFSTFRRQVYCEVEPQ